MHTGRSTACALALLFSSTAESYAQRAGDNAAAAADDAFGTTVGNESIGLYGAYDARGFSPARAGNVRIEGLYFDQQVELNNRVSSGNTVRVGISAQSYAFPAPTGIADFSLRLPGDKLITSTFLGFGAYNTFIAEVDSQIPVVKDKLSVGVGFSGSRYDNDVNAKNAAWNAGALARWQAAESTEVTAFWGREEGNCCRQQPVVFTGGAFLPPDIPLRHYWGQDWTREVYLNENFGALVRTTAWDDWTLRAGVFRSIGTNDHNFGDFISNVQSNGVGDHVIVAQPRQSFGSYSGEMRATRVFTDGSFRHTLNFALRGRDVQRFFGGADVRSFGQATIGVRAPVVQPVWTFGPTTDDHARQATGGVAYDTLWAGVGQLGVGIQKTSYHREIAAPGFSIAKSEASPLLYNATLSVFVSKDLAFYGSYTKGLEESGTAPPSAVNRGEAMPASITEQVDAGFRYALTSKLKLVAGVFQVEKPYFNVNAANVFGNLGTVRHRGVELSLAGTVVEGVSVVGGMTLIQPRLSGDPVDRGVVGRIPPGPRPRFALMSVTYQPPSWGGFSVDAQVYNNSEKTAHSDNLLNSQGWTEFNLGARYNFSFFGAPASLRVQAFNLTNNYAWNADNSGAFFPRAPRRFIANFTADF
ncbi:MAG: TonB-dependent receptor [Rhodospirillaceae bacterium]